MINSFCVHIKATEMQQILLEYPISVSHQLVRLHVGGAGEAQRFYD